MLSKSIWVVGLALLAGGASVGIGQLQHAPLHRVDRQRPADVTVTKSIRGSKTVAIVPSAPISVVAKIQPLTPTLDGRIVPPDLTPVTTPPVTTPPVQVAAVCAPSAGLRSASYVPNVAETSAIGNQLASAADRLPEGAKTREYEAAFAAVAVSSDCGCLTVKAALPALLQSNSPQLANFNRRARGALTGLASSLGTCGTGAISDARPFTIAGLPGFSVGGGSDYRR